MNYKDFCCGGTAIDQSKGDGFKPKLSLTLQMGEGLLPGTAYLYISQVTTHCVRAENAFSIVWAP